MSRYKGGRTLYLTKPLIEKAISLTRSNQAAAAYLKVSFPTYKKYAKLFKNDQGVSLFDSHRNQSGRGLVKPRVDDRKFKLDDILMGKHPTYPRDKLFKRILASKHIPEQCSHCGFHTKRDSDLKIPLILHHKNDNITDHRVDNLELLCYNCYFLLVGNLNTATLRNIERYIKNTHDVDVTYEALKDPNMSSEYDQVLTDEEKMNIIKSIEGL